MMDALTLTIRAEKKANDFGFAWPDYQHPLAQIISECAEIQSVIEGNEGRLRLEEEVGDLLNAAISLCLYLGLSPEEVISKSVLKYEKRLDELMRQTVAAGLPSLHGQPMAVLGDFWKKAKAVAG